MEMRDWSAALDAARAVRGYAYAPHSGFRVGAAIEDAAGALVTGCNVENASYGLTQCAERAAVAAWIASGARRPGNGITRVVISTFADRPTAPCGACRQWLAEFAPDAEVISVADPRNTGGSGPTTGSSEHKVVGGGGASLPKTEHLPDGATLARWRVAELIPDAFGPGDLPPAPAND